VNRDIRFMDICLRLLVCWRFFRYTNVFHGRLVRSANILRVCRQACVDDHECTGVDWAYKNRYGRKCWKSGPWSGWRNNGNVFGVDHYDLYRNCM